MSLDLYVLISVAAGVVIPGVIWGGFAFCLSLAIRKERIKNQ